MRGERGVREGNLGIARMESTTVRTSPALPVLALVSVHRWRRWKLALVPPSMSRVLTRPRSLALALVRALVLLRPPPQEGA